MADGEVTADRSPSGKAGFTLSFTAGPEHIDELGHVNNAVWVQWMEEVATTHWREIAPPEHVDAYVWVVSRHEIDYRGNIGLGGSATATTSIPEGPRGARFDRLVEFRDGHGKLLVSARSTWVMIDKASGRIMRVPREVAAPFLPSS